eukprot:6197237-Pleurochrysis_carterae.AAC.2
MRSSEATAAGRKTPSACEAGIWTCPYGTRQPERSSSKCPTVAQRIAASFTWTVKQPSNCNSTCYGARTEREPITSEPAQSLSTARRARDRPPPSPAPAPSKCWRRAPRVGEDGERAEHVLVRPQLHRLVAADHALRVVDQVGLRAIAAAVAAAAGGGAQSREAERTRWSREWNDALGGWYAERGRKSCNWRSV